MLWHLIVVVLIIIILIFFEYKDHDAIDGKRCWRKPDPPLESDSDLVYLDKIRKMIKSNYNYTTWRQSLLVGLIVALPVGYYLTKKIPSLFEWIVIAFFVFVAVYFSHSWLWVHFYYPSSRQLEKNIDHLRYKFEQFELDKLPPCNKSPPEDGENLPRDKNRSYRLSNNQKQSTIFNGIKIDPINISPDL